MNKFIQDRSINTLIRLQWAESVPWVKAPRGTRPDDFFGQLVYDCLLVSEYRRRFHRLLLRTNVRRDVWEEIFLGQYLQRLMNFDFNADEFHLLLIRGGVVVEGYSTALDDKDLSRGVLRNLTQRFGELLDRFIRNISPEKFEGNVELSLRKETWIREESFQLRMLTGTFCQKLLQIAHDYFRVERRANVERTLAFRLSLGVLPLDVLSLDVLSLWTRALGCRAALRNRTAHLRKQITYNNKIKT